MGLGGVLGICRSNNRGGVGCLAGSVNKKGTCRPSDSLVNTGFSQHYLRNEFNFCNVHGIMNTSGLLQSKRSLNFERDPNYS